MLVAIGPFKGYTEKDGKLVVESGSPLHPFDTITLDPKRIKRIYRTDKDEYVFVYEAGRDDEYIELFKTTIPSNASEVEKIRVEVEYPVCTSPGCPRICLEDPWIDTGCLDYVRIEKRESEVWRKPAEEVDLSRVKQGRPTILELLRNSTRRNISSILGELEKWDMILERDEMSKSIINLIGGKVMKRIDLLPPLKSMELIEKPSIGTYDGWKRIGKQYALVIRVKSRYHTEVSMVKLFDDYMEAINGFEKLRKIVEKAGKLESRDDYTAIMEKIPEWADGLLVMRNGEAIPVKRGKYSDFYAKKTWKRIRIENLTINSDVVVTRDEVIENVKVSSKKKSRYITISTGDGKQFVEKTREEITY